MTVSHMSKAYANRVEVRDAVHDVWGRPRTMNVSMPIAAVMLDLGFLMAEHAEAAIEYEAGV